MTNNYQAFILDQIKSAEPVAIELGYDAPTVSPGISDELFIIEAYLQELLGYISFTETANQYYS